MKVAVVPVVVGVLGTVLKYVMKCLEKRIKIIKLKAKEEFRITRKQFN